MNPAKHRKLQSGTVTTYLTNLFRNARNLNAVEAGSLSKQKMTLCTEELTEVWSGSIWYQTISLSDVAVNLARVWCLADTRLATLWASMLKPSCGQINCSRAKCFWVSR